MTLVKLPNLDPKEIQWIIQAMEHYCTHIQADQQDGYERLLEMLKHRASKSISALAS
jgi:hypothetical protein